jgi:hypothetical protein
MNRQSADRLTQAQALWAMYAPDRWPAALADEAWKKVLLYTEHTWGAWNSVSQPELPFVANQWAIKRGYAEEASALSKTLLESNGGVGAGGLRRGQHASGAGRMVRAVGDEHEATGCRARRERRCVAALASGELAVLVQSPPPFSSRRLVRRRRAERRESSRRGAQLANGRVSARRRGDGRRDGSKSLAMELRGQRGVRP